MTLTGATILKTVFEKERYNNGKMDDQTIKDLQIFLVIFILLLVIDLIIMFYAIYCLFNSNLEWYITLFILLLMFSPGFGFFTSIGIIFYYHAYVLKNKTITSKQPLAGSV
jgi:hypothetical protein